MTLDFLAQQAIIGAVGGEQQTVDAAGIQPANELALFFGLLQVIHTPAVAALASGLFGCVSASSAKKGLVISEAQGQSVSLPPLLRRRAVLLPR